MCQIVQFSMIGCARAHAHLSKNNHDFLSTHTSDLSVKCVLIRARSTVWVTQVSFSITVSNILLSSLTTFDFLYPSRAERTNMAEMRH